MLWQPTDPSMVRTVHGMHMQCMTQAESTDRNAKGHRWAACLQEEGQHVRRQRAHVLHQLQHLQRIVHGVALRGLRLPHQQHQHQYTRPPQ